MRRSIHSFTAKTTYQIKLNSSAYKKEKEVEK